MFVEASDRAETGDSKVKQNVGSRSNECQRHKIREGNLEKEIRWAHVARADGFARAGRVMHAVPELTDQARPMQQKTVENILDNVVPNGHEHCCGEKIPNAQMWRAGECQPRALERNHGRKQDKNLIEEHARQQLEIAKPIDIAHLEGREYSRPVAPLEQQPNTMKDGHLDRPCENRKRQSPRKTRTHVRHVLSRPWDDSQS